MTDLLKKEVSKVTSQSKSAFDCTTSKSKERRGIFLIVLWLNKAQRDLFFWTVSEGLSVY